MTRRSKHSIFISAVSVLLFTVFFLFTPLTRMTVDASVFSPVILLTSYSRTMSIGDEYQLIAIASDASLPKFKSSKSSIASVNTYGLITAKKAGTCKITAKIKNAEASCLITVKPTSIVIHPSSLTLYRLASKQLKADVSNGHAPVWKSSKSSVARVDENGVVTAVKHGTAKITAKADGTSVSCTVTVKQPKIRLSASSLSLAAGESRRLSAAVSSGNSPVWSTSNANIVTVDQNGRIHAVKKGRAYVYACEDGVKAKCTVTIHDVQS